MYARARALFDAPPLTWAAAEAAIGAGQLVSAMQSPALAVDRKSGNEPVTAADRAASDYIVDKLTVAFPADIVISEETADDARRLIAPRVWFVDPIDGTNDFIQGEDGYCVMIGLTVQGRPVAGYIYHPPSAHLYVAGHGVGAWVIAPNAAPVRMTVSSTADVTAARMVVSRSHRTATIDEVKSALGISHETNVGSVGLKLALIAVGERDFYVNPNTRTKMWDTCAPDVLLHEAGGRLSAIDGEDLDYRSAEIRHVRGLVASNGHLHAAAIAKLRPLLLHKLERS